jgi:hypothetical protein
LITVPGHIKPPYRCSSGGRTLVRHLIGVVCGGASG